MRSQLKNKRGKFFSPISIWTMVSLQLKASALPMSYNDFHCHFQKVAKEEQKSANLNVLDFSGELCHLCPEYSHKVALVLHMALRSCHAGTSCCSPDSWMRKKLVLCILTGKQVLAHHSLIKITFLGYFWKFFCQMCRKKIEKVESYRIRYMLTL